MESDFFSSGKKMFAGIVGILMAVLLIVSAFKMIIWVGAEEIVSLQYPTGNIRWITEQGPYTQWLATVTRFHKRTQFWFSSKGDQGKEQDESIKIRFNDGGHARISGSISWEMPIDEGHLYKLLSKYKTERAVEQQLIRTVVEKAVYMTGPLMSSKESYAERRNELLTFIEDQVQNGIYRTETVQQRVPDQMTGQMKTVNIVQLMRDKSGNYIRADESPLKEFGIRVFNPSINEVLYDEIVEGQIKQQQDAIMQVQTAIAQAKKSEQAAITAEKDGQAAAARAKWTQEALKAKAVTEAEQRKEVAKLDKEAAEFTRQRDILLGQGEGEKRRLIMQADGALALKLETLERVMGRFAQEFGKQNWTPQIVMGGANGTYAPGQPVASMMDLLTIQAAKTLGVDLSVKGGKTPEKK